MKLFFLFSGLLLLASCDAVERFDGIVLDKNTKQPVAGVTVIRIDETNHSCLTDSSGEYHFNFIVGWPSPEEFIFYKTGYAAHKEKLGSRSGADTVYLQRADKYGD